MNHEAQKQLLDYMSCPLTGISTENLLEFLWLVEQMRQELREQLVGRRPPWELDNPGP